MARCKKKKKKFVPRDEERAVGTVRRFVGLRLVRHTPTHNCGLAASAFGEEDLLYCTANSDLRARGEGAHVVEMYEFSVREI